MQKLRVNKVNKIYDDSKHNAFTTIECFGVYTYIAFRSGERHASFDGEIIILRSKDNRDWELCAKLQQEHIDLRDPSLLTMGDTLYVGCFGRSNKNHKMFTRNFFYTSKDGINFVEHQSNLSDDLGILWAHKAHKGKFYATGYSRNNNAFLLTSDDFKSWEKLLEFPSHTEISFDFDKDESLWAIARDDSFNNHLPTCYKLDPPYHQISFSCKLPIKAQGPLVKRMEGALVIIARNWEQPERRNLRTDIYWLEDGHDIDHITTLPSGGDTSYADWLECGNGKALVSYYSSHEYGMDFVFGEESHGVTVEHCTPANIYLAEISYLTDKK
jgi:hypothetical protein